MLCCLRFLVKTIDAKHACSTRYIIIIRELRYNRRTCSLPIFLAPILRAEAIFDNGYRAFRNQVPSILAHQLHRTTINMSFEVSSLETKTELVFKYPYVDSDDE